VGLRILSIMRGRCGSGPLLDCKCAADPLKHDGRLPGRASLSLPVCGRQKTRGPASAGPLVVLSRRRSLLTLRGVRSLWVPKIEFPAPTRLVAHQEASLRTRRHHALSRTPIHRIARTSRWPWVRGICLQLRQGSHPARIPHEVAGRRRRLPAIPASRRTKSLLSQ
jgi:hypothetical protein